MVEPPGPVDDDVILALVQAYRSPDGPRRVELAELEEAIENRAIFSDINYEKYFIKIQGAGSASVKNKAARGGRTRQSFGCCWWWEVVQKQSLTSLEVAKELRHIIRVDDAQEIDVVVAVKAGHLVAGHRLWPEDLHLAVQAVIHDEVVRHANAVRLHGVPLPVVIVADLGCFGEGVGESDKERTDEIQGCGEIGMCRRCGEVANVEWL